MWTDPFLLKALLAGIGVALMCGPLGCFVAWRRMAYFGDTIAHAALLGVVAALLLQWDMEYGILGVSLLLAALIAYLERRPELASDTLLGVASHGALALGLVLLSLSPSAVLDVNALLFGDILAVSRGDLERIYACAAAVLAVLAYFWRNLLRLTISTDIAAVEGVNVRRLRLLLMLTVAAAVAVSIKVVGILLITSLLIIPAAAARYFARTPTQMAFLSTAAGIAAVALGLYASLRLDTPSGPTIILAALGLFFVAAILSEGRRS